MPTSNPSSAATNAFRSAPGPSRQERTTPWRQTQAGDSALKALEAMLEFRSDHIVDDRTGRSEYENIANICEESLVVAKYENGGKPLARAFGKLRESYTELDYYYDPSKISYAGFEKETEKLQTELDEATDTLKMAALVSWFAADDMGRVATDVLGEKDEVDEIWAQGYKAIRKRIWRWS